MNWTGGQLRRHSARQGVLSKTQKQNFAKSRQQASNRVPRQPSTFRGVPGPEHGEDDRLGDEAACRDGQMMEEEAQNQSVIIVGCGLSSAHNSPSSVRLFHSRVVALTFNPSRLSRTTSPTLPPLAGSISADSIGHLNTLKRRLLQDPDWAGLAAARPLEVTFASAQEAEHFGKRRRLTETDRKRLSATHGNQTTLAFPKYHYWREKENALDQIQIRITGQSDSQHLQHDQGLRTPPDRHANHDFSQSPDLPRPRLSANARYSTHLRSDPSTREARPSTELAIPHRRHSTAEDQEQMDRGPHLQSSQRRQREPSCSPTEPLPASPTLIATDSSSTNGTGTQIWLPQPTRRTFPNSPLMSRAEAVNTPVMAAHVPYRSQDSSDPFIRHAEETNPVVPVRIFGQLVQMRSADEAE